jgi:general secretion pathway protein G
MTYRSRREGSRVSGLGFRPRTQIRNWNSKLGTRNTSASAGFTLIELIVVVVIIGLLAGLVLPQFIRQEEKAKLKATRAQIELLGTALDTFRLDIGRYPTTEEGLQALRQKPATLDRWDGPYIKKELPEDPWGKPYVYKSPGDHGPFDIISYAADGVPGGEGDNRDITSWER